MFMNATDDMTEFVEYDAREHFLHISVRELKVHGGKHWGDFSIRRSHIGEIPLSGLKYDADVRLAVVNPLEAKVGKFQPFARNNPPDAWL